MIFFSLPDFIYLFISLFPAAVMCLKDTDKRPHSYAFSCQQAYACGFKDLTEAFDDNYQVYAPERNGGDDPLFILCGINVIDQTKQVQN